MKFITGINENGRAEMIALDKVVSITGRGDRVKILTGAGLYWNFERDTLQVQDFSLNELEEVLQNV